jgi:hypothetical protein
MIGFLRLPVAMLILSTVACTREPDYAEVDKTFDGPSSELESTMIVPTLDTPIPAGQNAVWCSSFLTAWKSMAKNIAKGDISLESSPRTALALNQADDPTPHNPKGSTYVATGWNSEGIVDKIQTELQALFPNKPAPSFPDIAPDSGVAYSYLEANVKFDLPYFQNRKPLEFTDPEGRKTEIASFGIRSEDDYAYYKLRNQARILFHKGDPWEDAELEFAIDLCAASSPSQTVIARIKREPSLAKALERIDKESDNLTIHSQKIGPNDVLLIPNLSWQISHHFSDIEGKAFLNPPLKGQHLDVARQDILFRLDRSGAELKSESKMLCSPVPTHFVMDRPFLIFMRNRGDTEPYFAMWVDNAELLTPWTK